MRYAAILEVVLKHAFHANGRCTDFAIEPSDDTARLLRDHRCLLRFLPDGFRVVTPLDDAGLPFLPLPEGARLLFRLTLEDDHFALVTALSALEKIVARGFSPVFTNAHEPPGVAGELRLADGAPCRAFAEIEIVLHPGGVGRSPPAAKYWAAFEARQAYWAYYCVTDLPQSEITEKPLRILDGAPDPIVFTATALDEHPDPGDPIAVQLERLYPDKRRVRFLSGRAIHASETPRKHLKLALGSDDLLQPLPNPSPRRFSETSPSELPPRQHCLFQIIKYNANPWPSA